MSNPAPDHRWGQSRVQAPTARDLTDGAAPRRRPLAPVAPVAPAAAPPPAPSPPAAPVADPAASWEAHFDAVVFGEPAPEMASRPVNHLPATPDDHEGVYRGLLWVARTVKEWGAAIPRLAERLVHVESRVAAADARDSQTAERLDAMEELLGHLHGASRPDPALAARLDQLEHRLAALETLPATVEEVAARHLERMTGETVAAASDLEGVYRELDAVAEVVAGRDEAVGRSLQRLDDLEAAVGELRRRVSRFVDELDDDVAPPPAGVPAPAPAAEPGSPPSAPPEGARRALDVLTSELERIRQSIDVLVFERGSGGA